MATFAGGLTAGPSGPTTNTQLSGGLGVITPNTDPETSFNRIKIALSTSDNVSGNAVSEDFQVTGPSDRNLLLTNIAVGSKSVIALTSSTTEGSPFLKIYFPTPGSSLFYVTYATKDSTIQDGYRDLTNTMSTTFKNALKNWINVNQSTPVSPRILTRTLTFSFFGKTTNQVSASKTFKVNFSATFGVAITNSGTATTLGGAESSGG